MRSDPEPGAVFPDFCRERPVVKAHTRGPERADLFEMQRRVFRVGVELGKVPISEILNGRRERVVAPPEPRCGQVLHSGVVRPLRTAR